tara:strand:+ start:2967 stop:3191 length:225 start_codon:yes stop_codon:yes gene_type:complete
LSCPNVSIGHPCWNDIAGSLNQLLLVAVWFCLFTATYAELSRCFAFYSALCKACLLTGAEAPFGCGNLPLFDIS